MQLNNAVVLITGANRGIGLAFAREALARGARRVYAGARDPATLALPGVTPLRLDVNAAQQVEEAARACGDVTLLINNAGGARRGGGLAPTGRAAARPQRAPTVCGPRRRAQAFAPGRARNGGGAILNVLSVASWINRPILGVYGATKSAAWALTNGLRHELREQGTQVTGLHMGFVDTDLTRGLEAPKSTPEAIVRAALDGLEAGALEILADDTSRQVKQSLSSAGAAYLAAA